MVLDTEQGKSIYCLKRTHYHLINCYSIMGKGFILINISFMPVRKSYFHFVNTSLFNFLPIGKWSIEMSIVIGKMVKQQ